MHTIILGMIEFNVQHTRRKIFKAILKVRSMFGIFRQAGFIEEIPQFISGDWRESQNFAFEFMSGSDCYGVENAWIVGLFVKCCS